MDGMAIGSVVTDLTRCLRKRLAEAWRTEFARISRVRSQNLFMVELYGAAGVSIAADDSIPITSEEAVEFQALRATRDEARRFGASAVECGV